MALCLQASRDFDRLCEVSFVRDLHNVSPAALEVLSEHGCDILNLGGAWGWGSLILWLNWQRLFTSLSDQLTADWFTLNCSIKCAENAATVAEFSRISVGVDLAPHSRSLLSHFRLVIVMQLVTSIVIFIIRSLIGSIDEIIFNDLSYFRERIVRFQDRQRLRQELQRLISDQFAVEQDT